MPCIVRLPRDLRWSPVALAQGETIDWSLALSKVPDLWKRSRGRGIKIGILDSGCDLNHPDLQEAIDVAVDFTRSRFGPADRHGHGTHVAGTIGARANETGIIGVLPECRLHVYKVLDDSGAGGSGSIIAACDRAIDDGCHLVNCSFGSPQPDPTMLAVFERLIRHRVWPVCAAGNSGGKPGYPGAWQGCIGVAAYGRNGKPTRFSCRGREVDIGAYGEDILSCAPGGGHQQMSGTSMAAPFVSGILGWLIARHIELGQASRTPLDTSDQVIEHLRRGATEAGALGPNFTGGLINPGEVADATDVAELDSRLVFELLGFGLFSPARPTDPLTYSIGAVGQAAGGRRLPNPQGEDA
jgi:subtilisin family serine protease